jgi:ATP-dependent RNA helicase RhlE
LNDFNSLGLSKPILQALASEGYLVPTPIQAQAIPLVLEGRDLLGIAQTGTGKTAAFALPILQRLAADKKPAPRRGCRCLVLSPTRELATQIADSFRAYGKNLGLTVAVVFGGVKYGPQVRALAAGVDVLVATPGRLIDHLEQKVANLSEVEVFVLDEADQMLDLGFVVPIRRIAKLLPHKRQNLFFSATMPTEIGKLAGELLKDPAKVSVTPAATTVEKIDQKVLFIEGARKRALLAELFEDETMKRVLIFTRTKRGADRVAKQLAVVGVEAAAIHGDKTQGQRERSLAAFKAGQVQALVATDIAARGIDVDNISHVIQYELPNVPEAYVHRIGRTARAGAAGIAIAFCGEEERGLLRDIQRVTKQTIPSWDRRNDRTLGASEAALRAAEPAQKPEKPRQQQQHHRGRKPNGGHGQPQHRPVHRPDAYNPLTDAGAEPKRKPRRRNRSRNRAAAKANGGASVSA